jgi:hypothetical protein
MDITDYQGSSVCMKNTGENSLRSGLAGASDGGDIACISLGVDISPSTVTLNLRCERKDPISFVKLFQNSNLESFIQQARVPCGIKCFFDVQEYCGRRHVIAEIQGNVVRQPHTLQCRAVTCTENKLASEEQVSFFNMLLEYF